MLGDGGKWKKKKINDRTRQNRDRLRMRWCIVVRKALWKHAKRKMSYLGMKNLIPATMPDNGVAARMNYKLMLNIEWL